MPTVRRTLTLALLFVAAGSLIFTTGAAVIDGDADTFAEDRLAIQPADGPNGDYAYVNDNDEIEIDLSASNPNLPADFDGVNVDSTATINDVFTITYTAEQYAHVWIEYRGDDEVAFVADGDSIEGEGNNVTLAPNETVTVGLALDTSGKAAGAQLGADEFSINAKVAEPDDASAVTGESAQQVESSGPTTMVLSPSADRREFVATEIDRGESVQFLAAGMHLTGNAVRLEGIDLDGVRNERVGLDAQGSPTPFTNGSALTAPTTPQPLAYLSLEHDSESDTADAMTIRFSADPAHLNATDTDPEDVTLYRQTDAGEWEEVPVEIVDDEVVQVLGLAEDRVHFRATTESFSTFAVAQRVPRYNVTETTVASEEIDPGENATVRVTLRNGGGAAGERTVTLTANGTPVANETVALEPNETATVALSGSFETVGARELAVDGTPVGTLLVSDPTGDGTEESNDVSTAEVDATEGSNDVSTADVGTESTTEGGPTEEPFGIDPTDLAGLLVFALLAVAGLMLVRRMPR